MTDDQRFAILAHAIKELAEEAHYHEHDGAKSYRLTPALLQALDVMIEAKVLETPPA